MCLAINDLVNISELSVFISKSLLDIIDFRHGSALDSGRGVDKILIDWNKTDERTSERTHEND